MTYFELTPTNLAACLDCLLFNLGGLTLMPLSFLSQLLKKFL